MWYGVLSPPATPLVKDSNGTELTDSGAANFKLVIQRRIWETQISVTQNTVCHFPLCYTNCHEECSGGFTLGRWKLIECRRLANNRGICKECRHPITYHQHDKVAWCEKVEEKNCIDNETATVSIAQVLETIETYKKEIEEGTVGIGRLAEQYSELSLSGSFSGQVGKSVTLFETHLENMRNKSDPESVKRIEESLNQLKNKLRLLQDAAKAAHKKVYRPTIAD
ncbi:uncharacterized protein LACBIDRAFT_318382 [Laccaria bicolor S238N-H82]|uniref:Predicted protein n=1 Tax=Laccaria bicolor (strain S238N-H82 / ATCC MYA-4686) TaxID=486041 RepID=B0D6L9_LACBS|nr:uncharacterized protein LACBIDRAFT_318382 [Laccaria bicolor S238N-H82]EDR10209.1 predicted protein [Laccaria bicolor S238N-H82]|eukprot:XP_001879594.1 predicted protein [Laccaria bicolor S238N-H82]